MGTGSSFLLVAEFSGSVWLNCLGTQRGTDNFGVIESSSLVLLAKLRTLGFKFQSCNYFAFFRNLNFSNGKKEVIAPPLTVMVSKMSKKSGSIAVVFFLLTSLLRTCFCPFSVLLDQNLLINTLKSQACYNSHRTLLSYFL